ncbi:MAG TPA: hypothetical protein VGB79_15065 [Allosphingosinicella sp.]|jgi:hypothetical protein
MFLRFSGAAAAIAILFAAAPAAAEPAPGFDCAVARIPDQTRARIRQAYVETGIESVAAMLLERGLLERMSSCVAPGSSARLLGRLIMAHELQGAARIALTTRRGFDTARLDRAFASMSAADRALIAAGSDPASPPEARDGMHAPLLRLFSAASRRDASAFLAEPGLAQDFFAYVGSRSYLESFDGR